MGPEARVRNQSWILLLNYCFIILLRSSLFTELTAYQDQISNWLSSGIKVTQVFSEDTKRYVQSELEDEIKSGLLPKGSESRVGVLLCGQVCCEISEIINQHILPYAATFEMMAAFEKPPTF